MSFPELDPLIQLEHAEKIGLGSRKYRLINDNLKNSKILARDD